MKKTQTDHNLAFNGQGGVGFSRGGAQYKGNHSGQTMRENYGRGPTKGNASSNPAGAPKTMATAAQGGRIDGGTSVKGFAHPDAINVGMKK